MIALQPTTHDFAAIFFRSTHRRFMASAMRLRPSGLSLRLLVGSAELGEAVEFLLPFGRPGPARFTSSEPASS